MREAARKGGGARRWRTREVARKGGGARSVDNFPSTSGDLLILSNHFNLSIALLIHTVSSRVFHPHLVLIVSLSRCHEQPRLIVFYTYHTAHKALLVLS